MLFAVATILVSTVSFITTWCLVLTRSLPFSTLSFTIIFYLLLRARMPSSIVMIIFITWLLWIRVLMMLSLFRMIIGLWASLVATIWWRTSFVSSVIWTAIRIRAWTTTWSSSLAKKCINLFHRQDLKVEMRLANWNFSFHYLYRC